MAQVILHVAVLLKRPFLSQEGGRK